MASEQSSRALAVRDARCVLFAYHDAGYACLDTLLDLGAPIAALFTHYDAPGEEIWWRSCTELAKAHSIPVFTPDRLGEAEIRLLGEFNPWIIYSIYYRNLLPENVLNLAPLGAYNLHGSLLPRYRGRAPVNWMIINGETEGGVTLHHMVARADAGDIVAQRGVVIDEDDTALTLYRKIVPVGAALLREYHPQIVTGSAPRRAQDLGAGSYFGRRTPADGRIDWSRPSRRIYNLVRGVTHPYPGAFCLIGERKLFIWRARIGEEARICGAPGSIIEIDDQGEVEVAAGSGSIRLLDAQLEDGHEGSAGVVIAAAGGGIDRLD